MHIGIVAWSLFETQGGLERMTCDLARGLLAKGHNVTLFYNKSKRTLARPVFPVPEQASLQALDLGYHTLCIDSERKKLTDAGIDVLAACFAWESLLWFPLLLKGTDIRLVISEHNSPELINAKWNAYERHACLCTADKIHILLKGFLPQYPAELHDRITVIPNAVHPPERREPAPPRSRKTVIAAGRFEEKTKQFSLLLQAFALLADRFPLWDLEICGDGEAYRDYTGLVKKLGLGGRVRLPGMVDNLPDHYALADIFCIPSRYEGFGLVTAEAQGFGLPAVGFADCPGTNEIIVPGENGLLAETMTAECLARSLERLMEDPELRAKMGSRGRAMLCRYQPEAVYDAWERLLQSALEGKRSRMEEILAGDSGPDTFGTAELLARRHPFDRRTYIEAYERRATADAPFPFAGADIDRFLRKQKKFGFPGYISPLRALGRRVSRIFQ